MAAANTDHPVFAHLSDSKEQAWGQHDGQPVAGTYPTSEWTPDQIVLGRHTIEIGPEAPTGPYQLMTDTDDSTAKQRLAIAGPSDAVDDNRIVLTTLEVAMQTGSGPSSGSQGQ